MDRFVSYASPLLVLLPIRWRQRWLSQYEPRWARAAVLSGAAQFVVGLLLLLNWYLRCIATCYGKMNNVIVETNQSPPGLSAENLSFGMGLISLSVFALDPRSWLIAGFCIEGFIRLLVAFIHDEAWGLAPLALIDRALVWRQRRRDEARVPRVIDQLLVGDENRDGYALLVLSCREKPGWRYPLTIEYDGRFYQIIDKAPENGTPARPHAYRLRLVPTGEAFRNPERFDPTAVLSSATPSESPLREAFRSMLPRRRPPLVADKLSALRDSGGVRVSSCRPKPDWRPGRLIQIDDVFYRVESVARERSGPRPYIFDLTQLEAGVPGRNVIRYQPDRPPILRDDET
jgi:hypothetical protein